MTWDPEAAGCEFMCKRKSGVCVQDGGAGLRALSEAAEPHVPWCFSAANAEEEAGGNSTGGGSQCFAKVGPGFCANTAVDPGGLPRGSDGSQRQRQRRQQGNTTAGIREIEIATAL